MKIFLKKLGITFLLFLLGIVVTIVAVHTIVRYKADFRLTHHPENLIIGHSHPECAFDDNLINSTQNLSISGEGYFYNYLKIKEILSDNDIKTIFLEYSNNQIETRMDDWIWGYEKMNTFLPNHSPFMTKEEMYFLYQKNTKDFIKVISNSTFKNSFRVLSFNYSIDKNYGSYRKSNNINNSKKLNKADEIKKQKNISKYNIKYLKKIVDYCESKNVQVYFVRSPQHALYPRYNEEKLIAIKDEKFRKIEFLDFDTFPLNENEFADYGHLNQKGARAFSLWFDDLLKKGLLSKENKKDFIAKELEQVKVFRKTNY